MNEKLKPTGKPAKESKTIAEANKAIISIVALAATYLLNKYFLPVFAVEEVTKWISDIVAIGGGIVPVFFMIRAKLHRVNATETVE